MVSPVLSQLLLLLIYISQFFVITGCSVFTEPDGSLFAGAFRDILSSARVGGVQFFSGLSIFSGPSVSLAVISSSVPWIVSDIRSSPSPPFSPALPIASCPPPSPPHQCLTSSAKWFPFISNCSQDHYHILITLHLLKLFFIYLHPQATKYYSFVVSVVVI